MILVANLWIPILILLPNVLLIVAPPRAETAFSKIRMPRSWIIAENLGRIGVLTLPLFLPAELGGASGTAALAVMFAALALYYAGWLRFFSGRRSSKLLYEQLMGIPVPLAVAPVLYFAGSSLLLHSWFMSVFALLLAAGHIPSSLRVYHHLI
ncbi:hypothetical protein [Paenibacillus daejeonensis]|uniref:hypothetical protein n=1 Tax=Paenibacillus daejeonensis TaxID=135193 RepID=UPI00037DFF55|nr:hypothetical protein [Paenibacillus daejeonensis]